jgi:hypothetical protein
VCSFSFGNRLVGAGVARGGPTGWDHAAKMAVAETLVGEREAG